MKAIRLPAGPRALLFDLDSTLYTHPEYAAYQNDILVEEFARIRGVSVSEAHDCVEDARSRISRRTGKSTSLGNAMAELGIDILTSVAWRTRLIRPSEWLLPDARLRAALSALAESFALAVVTNNPRTVGEKSLRALGVRESFRLVVGLDDTLVSKPAREPFEYAARRLGTPASDCVSIGDRYDVDLAMPLELGMGAILVDGVEDVYRLPEILG